MACGREPGDPLRERRDEIAELGGGQRPVDPAVPLGQLGVVVLRAQHDLQRPAATHEPHEMLGGAPAGEQAERRLELTEDRRLARREAHVARQHELTAGDRIQSAGGLDRTQEVACSSPATFRR